MNKITNLLKSLLVVAMLGIGSMSAWADPILAFSQNFTAIGESTNPSDYGFSITTNNAGTATVTGGVLQYSLPANSGKDVSAWGTASFTPISTGNVVTVSCSWNPGGPTGTRPYSTLRVYGNDGTEDKVIFSLYNQGQDKTLRLADSSTGTLLASGNDWRSGSIVWNVVAVLNISTQKVVSLTVTKSGESTPVVSQENIAFENTVVNIKKFEFGTNKKSNYAVTSTLDNVLITYEAAASTADVTFKYEDTDGNDLSSLKADVVESNEVGASIEDIITSALKTSFYNGDESIRYDYSTYSCSDATVPAGGTTVTLKFATIGKYSYTVKAVDGSDSNLVELSTGDVFAGDAVTVAYPRYVLSGTTLYCSGTGAISYKTTFTPDADDYVKKITYNSGTVSNVVYYTEGEDVSGASQGANADRASVGKMGFTSSSSTYLDVTTLDPGIYKLYARGQNGNNSARAFSFKVGDTEVHSGSIANGTNADSNSDDFLVTSASTLSFACEGSSQSGMDYFYVVKTAECYESMSIVGDFSPNAWEPASGIEMTRDAENPHIWTAVVKDFVVTSSKYNYEYKATANGTWGVYELGKDGDSSKNQTYNFDYDGAREGKYTLTFTVNTSTNRVSLAIEKQHTYTVVGCYNNDDTPSFFGTAWASTLEDNDMTDNGDGTYTKTFNNVTLEIGTIWYKVVEDHAWTNSWGFDPSKNGGNADYYVGTAGTYHITFTFNPNADGYKVSCSLIPATVSKTISAAGWATYCSPYALDFTNAIANLDAAYIVTGGADGVLEMTEVKGIVPANTGLLLKGEGDVAIPVASSDANVDVSANKLEGVTTNTVIDAETGYVLMNDATNGLGFYLNSNAFTVGANTAYLPAGFDVTSARFFLLDGGKTTSISEQFLDEPSGKAERTVNSEKLVYDLQGRRVNSSLKPGLYIMSGKKVVIK